MKEGDVFIPYKVFIGVFIPNCVLEAEDLPPSAKLLYGVLSTLYFKYFVEFLLAQNLPLECIISLGIIYTISIFL